jgi:hypothetical protein
LRLYDSYITPILTYNACTWALTEAEMAELEEAVSEELPEAVAEDQTAVKEESGGGADR